MKGGSTEWTVKVISPQPSRRDKGFVLEAVPPSDDRERGAKGARRGTEIADREEAKRVAEAWARELNATLWAPPRIETFSDLMAAHIAWRIQTGTKSGTLAHYHAAQRRLKGSLGPVPVAEVTRGKVVRARDELLSGTGSGRPLGLGTVRGTMNCCSKAWRWGHERELVPCPWPVFERLKVPKTKKRPFTPAEVEGVLGWVRDYQGGYWSPLFELLADTGMRSGEAISLRGCDVNRARSEVYVTGGAEGAKTEDSEAWVPVPPETMKLLPEREDGNEWVFQPRRPHYRRLGRQVGQRVILDVLRRALRALSVKDSRNLDVASFRRTEVDLQLQAGVPVSTSMRVTRHRSTAVHFGYQRRSTSHDTHEAVRRTKAFRKAEAVATPAAGVQHQEPLSNSSCSLPLCRDQASC
jgi:integrase